MLDDIERERSKTTAAENRAVELEKERRDIAAKVSDLEAKISKLTRDSTKVKHDYEKQLKEQNDRVLAAIHALGYRGEKLARMFLSFFLFFSCLTFFMFLEYFLKCESPFSFAAGEMIGGDDGSDDDVDLGSGKGKGARYFFPPMCRFSEANVDVLERCALVCFKRTYAMCSMMKQYQVV